VCLLEAGLTVKNFDQAWDAISFRKGGAEGGRVVGSSQSRSVFKGAINYAGEWLLIEPIAYGFRILISAAVARTGAPADDTTLLEPQGTV
jgi:hypothetical protein